MTESRHASEDWAVANQMAVGGEFGARSRFPDDGESTGTALGAEVLAADILGTATALAWALRSSASASASDVGLGDGCLASAAALGSCGLGRARTVSAVNESERGLSAGGVA